MGSGAFTIRAGKLISVVAGKATTIYGDIDGNGAAEFVIRLLSATQMQDADFLLQSGTATESAPARSAQKFDVPADARRREDRCHGHDQLARDGRQHPT